MKTVRHHSSYLEAAIKDTRLTVKRAVDTLKPLKKEFDVIVVTGVSGLLIGPIVAYKLNKKLLVIRKQDDKNNSHCHYLVEGHLPANKGRWLFLDDFISSGHTLRRVYNTVDKEASSHSFYGFYGYRCNEFKTSEDLKERIY